jgi:hypothetical protein
MTAASTLYNRKVAQGRKAAALDSGYGVAYFECSAPEDWDPDDGLYPIGDAVARVAGAGGVVLVVAQFEEAFTLCDAEDARLLFIRALHALCAPAGSGAAAPMLVVLGVRADFYDRCLAYPEIVSAIRGRQMALGAMSVGELREAIALPAKAVGLQLEAGLADVVLADLGATVQHGSRLPPAGYDAGALPLLSHALLATWQRRGAGKLTGAG